MPRTRLLLIGQHLLNRVRRDGADPLDPGGRKVAVDRRRGHDRPGAAVEDRVGPAVEGGQDLRYRLGGRLGVQVGARHQQRPGLLEQRQHQLVGRHADGDLGAALQPFRRVDHAERDGQRAGEERVQQPLRGVADLDAEVLDLGDRGDLDRQVAGAGTALEREQLVDGIVAFRVYGQAVDGVRRHEGDAAVAKYLGDVHSANSGDANSGAANSGDASLSGLATSTCLVAVASSVVTWGASMPVSLTATPGSRAATLARWTPATAIAGRSPTSDRTTGSNGPWRSSPSNRAYTRPLPASRRQRVASSPASRASSSR